MSEGEPLKDHLILNKILSNLDFRQLKVTRLVCKYWNSEAFNKILKSRTTNINIHLNPSNISYASRSKLTTYFNPCFERFGSDKLDSDLEKEREGMVDFLDCFQIKHTLHISLFDKHPWMHNEVARYTDLDLQTKEDAAYFQQGNNLKFTENLINSFLPKLAPIAKEVRLELCWRTAEDYEFLEKIVAILEKHVQTIYIFLPKFPENGLAQKRFNHQDSLVANLGIRILGGPAIYELAYGGTEQNLTFSVAHSLLLLFPNVQFFDCDGPRPNFGWQQLKTKLNLFLMAFFYMCRPQTPLLGIRTVLKYEDQLETIATHCECRKPSPLRSLSLYMCFDFTAAGLQKLLDATDEIDTLDIIWKPRKDQVYLNLPPNLKSLTCSCSSEASDHEWIYEGDDQVHPLNDLFGLGQDQNSNFPQSLESLRLIMLGEEGIWNLIFPPENREKISSKLNSLAISLVGECESEGIQKFPRTLFPNLKLFRHLRSAENGRLLFVCEHKYDTYGGLLGRWEWLGGVRNYRFEYSLRNIEYLLTLRQKLCQGLEHEPKFTDTAWDLENTEHYVW